MPSVPPHEPDRPTGAPMPSDSVRDASTELAPGTVDAFLVDIRRGEEGALERLLAHVYPQMRQLAGAIFSDQKPGHTLQPTALVHEAWLKLAGNLRSIEDRRHFFVVAGMAMRQVVADHARGRLARKRGGDGRRVSLDLSSAAQEDTGIDIVALDDCLERLGRLNERHGRVAELRLFSGLSIDETAEELGVSPRSVDSDWAMAKAWLRKQLV